MTESLTIDPEVEAILREIAADPRSSLLRVTRPQVVKGLFERYPKVSPGMAGLTAAERQLLQVHRNEVAWLLREICKYRLATDERTSLFLSRNLTIDTEVEVLDEAALRAQASQQQRDTIPVIGEPEIVELLVRCTAGSLHEGPTTTQIAIASMRLEPNDSARICIGLDLTFHREARTALEVYFSLLKGDSSSLMASIAWDNAALAYGFLGAREEPLMAYKQSSRIGPDRTFPVLSWLFDAIDFGMEDEVVAAMARLKGVLGPNDRSLEWMVSSHLERNRLGVWSPSARAEWTSTRASGVLSGPARRLLDAIA